jgi:hypothetical protein
MTSGRDRADADADADADAEVMMPCLYVRGWQMATTARRRCQQSREASMSARFG